MTDSIKSIVLLVLVITAGVIAYQYFSVWSHLEEMLELANQQKATLVESRDELNIKVTNLEAKEQFLLTEISTKQTQIETHQKHIEKLDAQFKKATLGTLSLVDEQVIAEEFMAIYDYKDSGIKVREFPIVDPVTGQILKNRQGKDVTEPYLTIPIDYIKETVLAKVEVKTCQEQKSLLVTISGLKQEKLQLFSEITQLKEEKARNFAQAYEEAYASFSTIHQNYVDLLNTPPKVDLAPKWLQLVGGLVGGVFLCSL